MSFIGSTLYEEDRGNRMSSLMLIIAGFLFIAVAIITLVSSFNWQAALILAAIGIGIIFFFKNTQG